MSKIEAMIEKVKALINAPSCCAEAKEAANKWLEAVNTEKQDEAAKATDRGDRGRYYPDRRPDRFCGS